MALVRDFPSILILSLIEKQTTKGIYFEGSLITLDFNNCSVCTLKLLLLF